MRPASAMPLAEMMTTPRLPLSARDSSALCGVVQLREVEDAAGSLTSFQASSSKASGCLRIDLGGPGGQRAVDVDRHVELVLFEDLAQEVEQLLRPAHGEGRDDDVAARPLGLLEDLGQLVLGRRRRARAAGRRRWTP